VVRIVLLAALVAVCLLLFYVFVTFVQVWNASRADEAHSADTIIVLGAAQYDGRPSPVLQARLDRAVELYHQGIADTLIVTGGNQVGDRVTEAFSGFEYLRNQGIPEDAILLEVDGANTYEQLSASKLIMDNHGLETAVVVSDPYHSYRIGQISGEVGIDAAVSSTDSSTSITSLVRETGAVAVGRIISFRRLQKLT
jgi:vancomycin permeability regulator SanA